MIWLLPFFRIISPTSALDPSDLPTGNPSLSPMKLTLEPSHFVTFEQSLFTPTSAPSSDEQLTKVPSFPGSDALSSHLSQLNLTVSDNLPMMPSIKPSFEEDQSLVLSQIPSTSVEPSGAEITETPSTILVGIPTLQPSSLEPSEIPSPSNEPSTEKLTEKPSAGVLTLQPSFQQNSSLEPSQSMSFSDKPFHSLTTSVPSETKVTVKPSFSGTSTSQPSFYQSPGRKPLPLSEEPTHSSSTLAPSGLQGTYAPSGRQNSEPSSQPSQLKATTVPSATAKLTQEPSSAGTSNPVEIPSIQPSNELSLSPSSYESSPSRTPSLFLPTTEPTRPYSKSRKSKQKNTKTKKNNSSKLPKVNSFKTPKVTKAPKMPKAKSSKMPKSKKSKKSKATTTKKTKSSVLPQSGHNGVSLGSTDFRSPSKEAMTKMPSSNETYTNTISMSITSHSSSPDHDDTASATLIGLSLTFYVFSFLVSINLWV